MYPDVRSGARSISVRHTPMVRLCLVLFLLGLAFTHSLAQEIPIKISQYAHTAWRLQDGVFDSAPQAITQTKDGYLWIGTASGLVRFDGVNFVPWKDPETDAPAGSVFSLLAARDGSLWVGQAPALSHLQGGKLTTVAGTVGRVNQMLEDKNGTVWLVRTRVHDENGALCEVAGGVTQCDAPGKPRLNQVISDGTDTVWVSTGAKGLFRWRNKKWSVLSTRNGLPCDNVDSMIQDRSGALWLDLACGFVQIPRNEIDRWEQDHEYRLKLSVFSSSDGARPGPSTFAPSTARSAAGQLWFANDSALLMVDPNHLERNPLPPPIHILQFVADRVTYSTDGSLRLPALTRDISIDYAALSLKLPKAVRFRYQLSDVDKDWQDVGTRRQAFYMNLRPGHYTFRVVGCNNDGVWNMIGDQISFAILPAFYQTAWFRLLLALAAVAIMWTLFHLRVRAATRLIESRMGERLEERDRIARELHDTLLQGFQGLLLQLQTAIRKIPATEPERNAALRSLERGDEILLEGRERVRDLRSHQGNSGPVAEMLKKTIEQLQPATSPHLDLRIIGEPREVQLLVAEEVSLFTREALSNAIRHSHGSYTRCELHFEAKEICLVVQDNGNGIPQNQLTGAQTGHWGLQGMRERAAKLHSKIDIETGHRAREYNCEFPAGSHIRTGGRTCWRGSGWPAAFEEGDVAAPRSALWPDTRPLD